MAWLIFAQLLAGVVMVVAELLGYEMSMGALLLLSQLLMNIIPFAAYMLFTKKKFSDVLPRERASFKAVIFVLLMIPLAIPASGLLSSFSQLFFNNDIGDAVGELYNQTTFLTGILFIAASPAIFEELVYRGAVLQGYAKAPVKVAVIMSGVFFGLMHMNAQQFLYAVFLGVIMALIVRYSRNILLAVLFHFGFNGTQWTMAYFVSDADVEGTEAALMPEDIEMPELGRQIIDFMEANPIIAAIGLFIFLTAVSLPLLILVIGAFKKHCESRAAINAVNVRIDNYNEPEAETADDDPYTEGAIIKDPFVWGAAGLWLIFVVLILLAGLLL
jgi:hypothetical protein